MIVKSPMGYQREFDNDDLADAVEWLLYSLGDNCRDTVMDDKSRDHLIEICTEYERRFKEAKALLGATTTRSKSL